MEPYEFRLRAARTGGEDRQLAVWQRRVRVPASAWARGADRTAVLTKRVDKILCTSNPARATTYKVGDESGRSKQAGGSHKQGQRSASHPPSTLNPCTIQVSLPSCPRRATRQKLRNRFFTIVRTNQGITTNTPSRTAGSKLMVTPRLSIAVLPLNAKIHTSKPVTRLIAAVTIEPRQIKNHATESLSP